jgi:hypothetical protein
MAQLYETAKRVRKRIMDQVLEEGTCPNKGQISKDLSIPIEDLDRIFKDLEAGICIAVQNDAHAGLEYFQEEKLAEGVPEVGEIFYARPFASFKNHYPIWVEGEQKWHGECAVEVCGVSAMFPGKEVAVRSVCRQTKEPVEIIQRDGKILDYSPKTLRVHLGIPLRYMPDDAVGWCDYNSFFASEDVAEEWMKAHPSVRGITRDPVAISNFIGMIGNGRLSYDYQFTLKILRVIFQGKKYGFAKPLPGLGWHVPDPFWWPTLHTLLEVRRKGYGYYIRLSLL